MGFLGSRHDEGGGKTSDQIQKIKEEKKRLSSSTCVIWGARCSEGWVHKVQARSRDFGVTTAILLPRWPFSVSGKFAAFLERRVSQENPARGFVLCGGVRFWPAARV